MTGLVIDTSALFAVLLDEPESARCIEAMSTDTHLLISAGTLAESGIVARRRGARVAFDRLMARLKPEIVLVTAADAHLVADADDRWGKGAHPSGLNLGDCFAYALAKAKGYPLLCVGDDFFQTDITIV
jgi:ribonuclease VapC